jgi:dTDP-4-dehydrorhamnose reductase
VALLGANGQLGSDLSALLAEPDLHRFTRSAFDVRDAGAARVALAAVRPEVIINTAAFHKVEECEVDPGTAFAVNATAAAVLATIARELGARYVFLSTDYVYGGTDVRPLSEDVPPAPVNVYGVSKEAGERLVLLAHPGALIVRSSGLFGVAGAAGKGGNFIQTVLRLAREKGEMRMVNDQRLSPTYTADLAAGIVELVCRGVSGIVHLTNSESCTWFELASHVVTLAGIPAKVMPCTTAEIGSPVRRPQYSVLANARWQGLGLVPLRPWREAVEAYLLAKGLLAAA